MQNEEQRTFLSSLISWDAAREATDPKKVYRKIAFLDVLNNDSVTHLVPNGILMITFRSSLTLNLIPIPTNQFEIKIHILFFGYDSVQ